jgi:hypothetical protein
MARWVITQRAESLHEIVPHLGAMASMGEMP